MIAFEVAGLLLTAALVGAIAIAHREEGDSVGRRVLHGDRRMRRARRPMARARRHLRQSPRGQPETH